VGTIILLEKQLWCWQTVQSCPAKNAHALLLATIANGDIGTLVSGIIGREECSSGGISEGNKAPGGGRHQSPGELLIWKPIGTSRHSFAVQH